MRAEVSRHRIELPAAFVDRCARTRSISVDVLTRQRLNTNLIKDFRIVLDVHGPTCSGRELASRFQELGSHLLKVLHFLSPLHFALQNTTDLGKRCLFGIGLNAQVSSAGDTRQEAEAVKMTKRAPPSMGGGETAGPLGLAESGAGEPRIVYGPTGLGVTPTQERDSELRPRAQPAGGFFRVEPGRGDLPSRPRTIASCSAPNRAAVLCRCGRAVGLASAKDYSLRPQKGVRPCVSTSIGTALMEI